MSSPERAQYRHGRKTCVALDYIARAWRSFQCLYAALSGLETDEKNNCFPLSRLAYCQRITMLNKVEIAWCGEKVKLSSGIPWTATPSASRSRSQGLAPRPNTQQTTTCAVGQPAQVGFGSIQRVLILLHVLRVGRQRGLLRQTDQARPPGAGLGGRLKTAHEIHAELAVTSLSLRMPEVVGATIEV